MFHGGHFRDGSWSLSCEAFFYALFPLIHFHAQGASDRALITGIRVSLGLMFCFSILSKLIQPMDSFTQMVVFYSMPFFRLPEFVIGVFAGMLALRPTTVCPIGKRLAFHFIGVFIFMAIFPKIFPYVAQGMFVIPFLIELFNYFTLSSEGPAVRVFSNPFFVFCGEASFALYLVQLVTIPWFKSNAMGLGLRPAIALCFVVTLVLACVVHLLIERPMRPIVTRLLSPKLFP